VSETLLTTIADKSLSDIADMLSLPVETLAVYVADAIADIYPLAIFAPQIDPRDPYRVLSDFCLRILGGEYDFTIKEMCAEAHVPFDLLESAVVKRLSEAGIRCLKECK
jgi:hypothetical protein